MGCVARAPTCGPRHLPAGLREGPGPARGQCAVGLLVVVGRPRGRRLLGLRIFAALLSFCVRIWGWRAACGLVWAGHALRGLQFGCVPLRTSPAGFDSLHRGCIWMSVLAPKLATPWAACPLCACVRRVGLARWRSEPARGFSRSRLLTGWGLSEAVTRALVPSASRAAPAWVGVRGPSHVSAGWSGDRVARAFPRRLRRPFGSKSPAFRARAVRNHLRGGGSAAGWGACTRVRASVLRGRLRGAIRRRRHWRPPRPPTLRTLPAAFSSLSGARCARMRRSANLAVCRTSALLRCRWTAWSAARFQPPNSGRFLPFSFPVCPFRGRRSNEAAHSDLGPGSSDPHPWRRS